MKDIISYLNSPAQPKCFLYGAQSCVMNIAKTAQYFKVKKGRRQGDSLSYLDRTDKVLVLRGGLSLPFDHITTNTTGEFICTAVHKIHKLQLGKLCELAEPW